jgi:phospholipid/cholesterol/gamma-HCH transport system ATP-binding protein
LSDAGETGKSPTDSVVSVVGLHAGYGAREILSGVSMEVAPGEVRAVLGRSGCGKSTLLRNILGLEKPWSGTARVLGEDLAAGGPEADVALSRIGVLFQDGALVTSLTVGQNVMLPLVIDKVEPSGAAEELARACLSQVRLDQAWGMLPSELSGGMRKRTSLARALVREPRILFCDEPSAGLDPLVSRELDDLLLELHSSLGLAIVLVSHELDSIKALAQKILFLDQGAALFDGTLQDAMDNGPDPVRNFFSRRVDPADKPPPSTWEIIQ